MELEPPKSALIPISDRKSLQNMLPAALAPSFHPDIVMIDVRPLPLAFRISMFLVCLAFLLALLWLFLAKLDRVVDAEGKLQSRLPNQVVQPLVASVLKKIDVVAGEMIPAGRIIAVFEQTTSAADVRSIDASINALKQEATRNAAELELFNNKSNVIAPALSDLLLDSKYQELLAIRTKSEEAKSFSLQQKLSMENQLAFLKTQENIARDDLTRQKQLQKNGLATNKDVRITEDKIANLYLQGQKLLDDISAASRQAIIASQDLQRYLKNQIVRIESRQIEIKNDLEQKSALRDKANYIQKLDRMTAQNNSIVLEVTPKAPSSTFLPQDIVAVLSPLPSDKDLFVLAKLTSKDTGWVRVGQKVRFKLNSLPFTKHGAIVGEVTSVTQLTGKDAAGLFGQQIIIAIRKTALKSLPAGFQLLPEMVGRAEINVGNIRAIDYLLGPIIEGWYSSMQESR